MKKKVSKLAAVMLILVMAAAVFTGCGQNSTQNTTEESTITSKAYESQDIKVAALKGPTAIGMVKLMNDNEDKKTANNYTFQIEAAAADRHCKTAANNVAEHVIDDDIRLIDFKSLQLLQLFKS